MQTQHLVVHPLPSAGLLIRFTSFLRSMISLRVFFRLAGHEVVVLQGRVLPVRPVPLNVAREMMPAIVRCSEAFVTWNVSEELFDDLIKVLSLGLGVKPRYIESLTVSFWDLARVLDVIARVNGLQVVEAGKTDLGKLMVEWSGMNSMPGSSAQPDGPGSTSTSA